MESERPFVEVSLLVSGAQLGQHRFERYSIDVDTGGSEVPSIAPWRCNLTALSQCFNVYFVAYGEKIYVYQPQFPTQVIPKEPEVVIDTLPSSPGLPGYINPRRPHAINKLVVQYLGQDEVLAVVRDDGDVDAYLTRHIHQALERRHQASNSLGTQGSDLRPFFQRNVGISAWGLAIHGEARMIAVSSNHAEVTIFTFALTREGNSIEVDDDLANEEERIYHMGSTIIPRADREQNDTRVIANGKTNIPDIAFCNTGHDPSGRWLISTDISGVVRSWDIHKLKCGGAFLATVHPSAVTVNHSSSAEAIFDRFNAGWSVMFLDPRSFRTTKSLPEALGVSSSAGERDGLDERQLIWDISATIEQVKGRAEIYEHRSPVDVTDGNYTNPTGRRAHHSTSPSATDTQSSPPRPNRTLRELIGELYSIDGEAGFLAPDTMAEDGDNGIGDGNDRTGDDDVDEDDDDDDASDVVVFRGRGGNDNGDRSTQSIFSARADNVTQGTDERQMQVQTHDPTIQVDDDYDMRSVYSEYTDMNSGDEEYLTPRRGANPDVNFQGTHSLCPPELPCPIFHASVTTLHLFQPAPTASVTGHAPIITLADPFYQELPLRHFTIDQIDRCNMAAQIAELGVVVVATQKGRVAILSLTQVATKAPDPMARSGASPGVSTRRVYGFRVDHVLPLASQEAAGHRPPVPLHGVAVGPVQGTEKLADGEKRWRLMIMYQDHTVLSYEICKAPDESVDVGGPASVVI
ncbi:hypothetical protein AAFC00_005285 [Neodothiora populina]|uniref:Uncharacterized protein n=1 Tax=Neodothiora populina TaxID=2781224 RepID=A0ABR3PKE4_9PEZI